MQQYTDIELKSMIDFLAKLQTEHEQITKSRIGRLEPGLLADEVMSTCKQIVEDVRTRRNSINEIIQTHLHPMLENITDLSDDDEAVLFETAQKISAHETRIDPGFALKIYQSLLKRAQDKKDRDKTVKYYYWCGITLFYYNQNQNEQILKYFEEGASYYKLYRRIENEETRRYIHRCLGNYHMQLFHANQPEKVSEAEDDIFSFWNSIIFSAMDPGFPWLTYFLTCLTHKHAYLSRTVHIDPDYEPKENLQKILDIAIIINKLYQKNKDIFSIHGGTRYDFTLWEAQFLCGLISFEQLLENVYNKQETFAPDDYSSDAIYVKITLFSFVVFYAVHMKALSNIKKDVLTDAFKRVLKYLSLIPKTTSTVEITRQFKSFASGIKEYLEPTDQLNLILELTAFRNITTHAHSVMVSKLAVSLTKHLFDKNPDVFIGCLDYTTVDDLKTNLDKLYEFAEICGLCHDIGKYIYMDNQFMIARSLNEDELEIVRSHPTEGHLIYDHKDNAPYCGYSDIILGHHKHYDNKGGYPETFDLTESKHRIMIDIIKVADSIDAATDEIGKSYAPVKDLNEVYAEINEASGSEYSPVLAELINDASVKTELKQILDVERKKAYFTAYSHAWN